jgi:hypothetical protein
MTRLPNPRIFRWQIGCGWNTFMNGIPVVLWSGMPIKYSWNWMNEAETKRGARWRLEDLVAYECALAQDSNEEWAVLKKRDARLSAGAPPGDNRRQVLLHWLNERRKQEPGIDLAADSVSQSLSVAGKLLGVTGFLLGIGAATAALAYTGQAPINVSVFAGIFILLQVVMALILVLAFCAPRGLRELLAFGPLFRGCRWVMEAVLNRLQALGARLLSGKNRQDAAEWAGTARRAISLHGSLSKWVAFVMIQAAALLFNVGVLIALLFAVLFSDRAFGWQTTLDVSGEAVHQLVKWLALPWSWVYGEGLGYPDLSQIQGSRIVLKEGIHTLQSSDLAAWWRFLALGILSYGVLPRMAFYLLGKWQVRRTLARLDFRNAASERLMQRLAPSGSLFIAEKVSQEDEATDSADESSPDESGPPIPCLCSAELAETINRDALRALLARLWNRQEVSVVLVVYEGGKMQDPVQVLGENAQVAILFESWMPPIREQERQLKALRAALEKHVLIKLVLLGIPGKEGESVSLRPELQYLQAWKAFVNRLGDPYLMLENSGI